MFPVQVIPKSVSLSPILETLRSCCRKPVKKCCGSSIRTPPGRPYCKILHSTRFGSHLRFRLKPHALRPQLQAMQKNQVQTVSPQPPGLSSPMQPDSQLANQSNQHQHPFAMSNPSALAFATQQMGMDGMGGLGNLGANMINPMLHMHMGMGGQFNNPTAMQSVMRNPSPGPAGMHGRGGGFMNMSGQF